MYDANAGRFIQRDAIGETSGAANLYFYVDDGPIDASDPLGWQAQAGPEKKAAPPVTIPQSAAAEQKLAQDKFEQANNNPKSKTMLEAENLKECKKILDELVKKAQAMGTSKWLPSKWRNFNRACCKHWTNAYWEESEEIWKRAEVANCFTVERVAWEKNGLKNLHAGIRITFHDGSVLFLDDGQMMRKKDPGPTSQVYDQDLVDRFNPGYMVTQRAYPEECLEENLPK